MAFDFPDSPAIDDEHTEGGVTYRWTAQGVWDIYGGGDLNDKVNRAGDTMTVGPLETSSQRISAPTLRKRSTALSA